MSDGDGMPAQAGALVRCGRERARMAGDELRRIERELDRIFSSLGHGMYVVDLDRRVLLWNKAAELILGWTEEDVLGRSCRDFIDHVDEKGASLCDKKCPLVTTMGESHTVFAGNVWAEARDGRRVPVNVSCAPVFDEDRLVGAVEVFSDMTHEKEVEDFKNSMVSVVAHELRTPLTSMKGYLELVADGDAGGVNEKQREFLDIVGSSITRLEDLVNDLLDVGRLESGRVVIHWEPLDLAGMAEEAVKTYAPLAGQKGLGLDTRYEETPPVQGDNQLFNRVVQNLVSNALKYTNEGEVTVTVGREGDRAFLEVTDSGVGIPPEEIGNVMKKFFRASTASQTGARGSGLGLAIVRDIIKMHGGEVRLESEVGRGSSFKVLLPPAAEPTIIEAPEGGDNGG